MVPRYKSSIFPLKKLRLGGTMEQILPGGRSLFPLLVRAFDGVKKVVIVGWGSQAPAQATNLRDSLKFAGCETVVSVALRPDSESWVKATEAGFSREAGTLGTIVEMVPQADMVVMLISDAGQVATWQEITSQMKSGATLGFCHGFLVGHLTHTKQNLRNDIDIIMMAPKGMGPSLRRLYLQGASMAGAGINSSVAIEQDVTGKALERALGWAVGTGSPVTFFTTMRNEVISDLFGERGILLGAVSGLVEALYEKYQWAEEGKEWAFQMSAKGLTSTVALLISQKGLLGMYKSLTKEQRDMFQKGYTAAYQPAFDLMEKIYDEVSSFRELGEVVRATEALKTTPMTSVEQSEMWAVGAKQYEAQVPMTRALAYTAGAYVACVMAQMRILRKHGHCVSEIVNESLIEAIDSLLPYMDKRGISYMVDNCSITARLGTRKWGPLFKEAFMATMLQADNQPHCRFRTFLENPLHKDVKKCFRLRPSVRIALE